MRNFKIGDKVEFEMGSIINEPGWNFDLYTGRNGKYETGKVAGEDKFQGGLTFWVKADSPGVRDWCWPQLDHSRYGKLYGKESYIRLIGGGSGSGSGKVRLVDKGGYYMTEVIK